ncbi:response regulator [Methyloradius palustris]|uniref:DNA-binding response regulator n=1 Tax=Methyloradius palustris TaxID=2778876 RepID=A0A8D5G7C8_9PROT|nr:response regulator transcription factor [Methyloradius palustris]BCM24502.1 DNA-binding response regulator [Methyloradius palustris]
METKVLLADDHIVVRQGLRTLLEQLGYTIVAEASSGERAYALWQECKPDVGLLDLDMPGIGGLETLKRIIERDTHAKIIVFSLHDDNLYAMRALQAGAKGYLVKSAAPEVLIEAVEKVLKGGNYISHEIAQYIAMHKLSDASNPAEYLSPREFEIFRRVAKGESLSEISASLQIGYKTAANLQTQVRQKIGATTTGQLVHLAIRFGVVEGRE